MFLIFLFFFKYDNPLCLLQGAAGVPGLPGVTGRTGAAVRSPQPDTSNCVAVKSKAVHTHGPVL